MAIKGTAFRTTTMALATILAAHGSTFLARALAVRAFTARRVMRMMRTFLRHRKNVAADIFNDVDLLLHHPFDGDDLGTF